MTKFRDWQVYGDPGQETVVVSYEFTGTSENSIVQLKQSKPRQLDYKFLEQSLDDLQAEDPGFEYSHVRVDDSQGVSMVPKYGPQPSQHYNHDPRRTVALYFIKGRTFIELRSNNTAVVGISELVLLGSSL